MSLLSKVADALKPVHVRRAEAKAAEDAKNPDKARSSDDADAADDKDDKYGFRKGQLQYNADVQASAGALSVGMWSPR